MDTNDNAEKKPVQEKGGMLKDNSSSDFLFDPETNSNNVGKTAITGALATQPRIKLLIFRDQQNNGTTEDASEINFRARLHFTI